MKRLIRKVTVVLIFVTIFSFVVLSGASFAAEKQVTLAKEIQGCWSLVSIVNEQDGKQIEVFGPNPRGSLIMTPDGRFSMILMNATLPKFASNSRTKSTAEENRAVVHGSIAFFGTYKVAGEKKHIVNLRIEGSTFPNWDGQEQQRTITVTGDEMKYVNPTPAIGDGINYVVWKRTK